jgi:hypothetical protein
MHDARPSCGFLIELHQDSAFLTDFFASVSAAALDWDGRDLLRPVTG